MFIGSVTYSVDAKKGRINIPAKFKKSLPKRAKDTFVLTRGNAQCINVYPLDYWLKEIKPRIDQLNDFDPDDSGFKRSFLEVASEEKLDSQLRLQVPKRLLEFAGIDKEVFILGQVNKIEFWNPEIFKSHINEIPIQYPELAKQVMQKKPK